MRNLFKLYRNLKQFTILIIVGVALMYLSVRANLELPTLMSNIVDKGIIAGDTGYIWKEGGIMLLVSAAGGICAVLASLMASRSALGLGKVLRAKIFTHVENFSLHDLTSLVHRHCSRGRQTTSSRSRPAPSCS